MWKMKVESGQHSWSRLAILLDWHQPTLVCFTFRPRSSDASTSPSSQASRQNGSWAREAFQCLCSLPRRNQLDSVCGKASRPSRGIVGQVESSDQLWFWALVTSSCLPPPKASLANWDLDQLSGYAMMFELKLLSLQQLARMRGLVQNCFWASAHWTVFLGKTGWSLHWGYYQEVHLEHDPQTSWFAHGSPWQSHQLFSAVVLLVSCSFQGWSWSQHWNEQFQGVEPQSLRSRLSHPTSRTWCGPHPEGQTWHWYPHGSPSQCNHFENLRSLPDRHLWDPWPPSKQLPKNHSSPQRSHWTPSKFEQSPGLVPTSSPHRCHFHPVLATTPVGFQQNPHLSLRVWTLQSPGVHCDHGLALVARHEHSSDKISRGAFWSCCGPHLSSVPWLEATIPALALPI